MPTQTIHYNKQMIPSFFKGVSREDLRWTISYLSSLLDVSEDKLEAPSEETSNDAYSMRIQTLLNIPKRELSPNELYTDARLQSILER